MFETLKRKAILITIVFIFGTVHSIYAATFTVNQTGDAGDGVCDATCTLRDAVTAANNVATNDVIQFNTALNGQTIALGGNELVISNNGSLQINGLGANFLTISGQNASRIFRLTSGASVTILGLTITNGNGAGGEVAVGSFSGGGAILVDSATLDLINTAVINNIDGRVLSEGEGGGGGLFAINSTIEITNSNISNNSQPALSGGGIYLRNSNSVITGSTFINNSGDENAGGLNLVGGSSTITNSTINNNMATTGGGFLITGSSVKINDTTVHSNTAQADGGGINTDNQTGQSTSITNSTISGNSVISGEGGGITNRGELVLENTTLSGNSATLGGGLYHILGVTRLRNTIIANSTSGGDCERNPNTAFTNEINADFSLIESGLTCVNGTNSNNRTGDPALGPLQNNGGSTLTHEPSPTSQVIDVGSNSLVNVSNDQRGFTRITDGDNNGSNIVDIGSVEYIQTTFVVTKTADTLDGFCNADCSLREAIAATNANGVPSTIEFASPLFDSPQTITLQGLELSIANRGSLTINGKGAGKLTISGQNASRVFLIEMNATATINGLTIRDGNGNSNTANGNGGGILNFGTLNLSNATVRNNTATDDGGGINNATGILTITNSTINNNLTTDKRC